MVTKWDPSAESSVVDVRVGGAGNKWQILDPHGMLDAPSGGGRDRETLWGRGERGGLAPRGIQYTGNPHDWSFNLSYPLTAKNILERIFGCPSDVRGRQRCGRIDNMTDYGSPGILGYLEVTNNDFSYDNPLAQMDGTGADVKRSVAATATFEQVYVPVAHDDLTKQWSDADFNWVINIGQARCFGRCGLSSSEEDQFLAVTDRDSTPGYSGNAAARLYYTLDKGVTQASVSIDLFTAADATGVVYLGDRIVVFSPDKAPAYASFKDILKGITAPNLWTACTGFSGIAAGNFPKAASAPNSSVIMAVGNGGRIWKSTDGGISFTLIDAGVTTAQNLNTVDFADEALGYIGGNSGVLLRYVNGSISIVSVTDGTTTLSANINRVRTPDSRETEVYIGTANGQVWRSRNATNSRPTFENLPFTRSGEGAINDIDFAGYKGDVMFVLQRNAANTSRVLRDFSGGAMSQDVEEIGDFNTPGNFGINSIAAANPNFALTVGQIHESYGFIGQIRPNNL